MNEESKLIVGDVLETLRDFPDGLVDLGITSPPYNKMEKQKGWLVKNVLYENSRDALPEAEYQQQQVEVLDEIFRITRPGGSFFYNHKCRWVRGNLLHPMDWLRKTRWVVKQEIIWDRVIAANIRGWRFWQVEERIYWLYKPIADNKIGAELASRDAKLTSIWRGVPEGKNSHPAPFPLWLPARVIISLLGVANADLVNGDNQRTGLVLDPYMGSGTTAVAAELLGHRYIGIDISPEYTAQARERIQAAKTELPKLLDELALHEVKDTFTHRKTSGKNVGKFRGRPVPHQKEQAEQLVMDT
ncbi:MAG: site-specific DNA-methyltransferase [Anaerolineaceae bacterium]|nr:site-specific DNA-methyltransferase [Anaerolineaceae bacterium]